MTNYYYNCFLSLSNITADSHPANSSQYYSACGSICTQNNNCIDSAIQQSYRNQLRSSHAKKNNQLHTNGINICIQNINSQTDNTCDAIGLG